VSIASGAGRADESGRAQSDALVAALRSGGPATAGLVNVYYTLCIPFYREFLGDHWHTGFHVPGTAIGPQDQLRMERLVAESAGVTADCVVLDVGCGVGGPACHLARVTGARLRGLTPNPVQLEMARATAALQSLGQGALFDLGDASHLPYPDNSFDVVLFFESACHFPDRAKFFSEAWRVLRPGGRLAGEDWLGCERAPPALRELWSQRICRTWAIPGLGTVPGYQALMAAAGFHVEIALDMREEMDLLQGFMVRPEARRAVQREMERTPDPIRRLIMEGLMVLGEAAQNDAFTVGRFLARKPAAQ
jgi:SAM-dependent methyltransferase